MDRIVLDIETKNSFEDVGGRDGLKKLDVSVVGVYSYSDDKYIALDEGEMEKLGEVLEAYALGIGEKAIRFAQHAKRKTIKASDITEAMK